MDEEERKSALAGLPPLPKSLAGIGVPPATTTAAAANPHLSSELFMGASTSAAARNYNQLQQPMPAVAPRHGSLSSTQESLSDRESLHSHASSSHSSHHTPTNTNLSLNSAEGVANGAAGGNSKLDTQLAILRREMYSLRQLDLSLLSQLWALNESIQGFRVFLQERETLSPHTASPSQTPSDSLSSEPEDEREYPMPAQLMPPAVTATSSGATHPGGSVTSHASTSSASGTSGSSSAASSMGKRGLAPPPPPPQRQPPQLPRVLQQRMRRAPPPPPPTPPTRPNKPPNKIPENQRPV